MVVGLPNVKYSLNPPPTRPSAKYHCIFTGTDPPGVGVGEVVAVGEGTFAAVGVGVGVVLVIVKLSVNLPPELGRNCIAICVAETVKREMPQVWFCHFLK